MKEKLNNHFKKLDKNVAPMSVDKKNYVAKWKERVEIFEDFMKNFDTYQKDIKIQNFQASAAKPSTSLMDQKPNLNFQTLGAEDGGVVGAREGAKVNKKPIILIAANAEHIGGSLYRVPRTGNAQEEQLGNTYAGPLALASVPGVADSISPTGDIHYSKKYHDLLLQRGAIDVTNVPGSNGTKCDQLLVAAPDLKNGKECFANGKFQAEKYAEQMLTMYRNAFTALASKDPDQPIVFTLPGSGVFLGEDQAVKDQAIKIQGLCLKQVMNENPALADRKFYLPYGNNAPVFKIAKGDVDPSTLNAEKQIVNKALVNLENKFTPAKPGADKPAAGVGIVNNYGHQASNASEGRFHLFSASGSSVAGFKQQFQAMRGDHLKTKILEDFKSQIENINSPAELKTFKDSLKNSAEFKVLNTGQGLFTKVTGIKTSSVAALEDMISQKEESLKAPTPKM